MEQQNKGNGTDLLLITTIIIASMLSAAIYLAIETETGKNIIAVVASLITVFVLVFQGIIMSMLVEIRNKIEK